MKNEILELNNNTWINTITDLFESFFTVVLKKRNQFNLAISGGATPMPLYKLIGEKFKNDELWRSLATGINVFWVDERPVSINHPESNAGNALKYLKDTGLNLFPIKGDAADLKIEAGAYQQLICDKIKLCKNSSYPNFDLILLGLGYDGHIASLFPESEGIHEKEKLVISNQVPQLFQTRLTLTFPILLAAKEIWVLCKGREKKDFIEQLLNGKKAGLPVNYLIENYKPGIKWYIAI